MTSIEESRSSSSIERLSSAHVMASSKIRYEAFLINNVSTISTLESSLRSITWFLPGRFKDAELASEARQFSFFAAMVVTYRKTSYNIAKYHEHVS